MAFLVFISRLPNKVNKLQRNISTVIKILWKLYKNYRIVLSFKFFFFTNQVFNYKGTTYKSGSFSQ